MLKLTPSDISAFYLEEKGLVSCSHLTGRSWPDQGCQHSRKDPPPPKHFFSSVMPRGEKQQQKKNKTQSNKTKPPHPKRTWVWGSFYNRPITGHSLPQTQAEHPATAVSGIKMLWPMLHVSQDALHWPWVKELWQVSPILGLPCRSLSRPQFPLWEGLQKPFLTAQSHYRNKDITCPTVSSEDISSAHWYQQGICVAPAAGAAPTGSPLFQGIDTEITKSAASPDSP